MNFGETLALRSRLANLSVHVDSALYETKPVELSQDPEGFRPSGLVTIGGTGQVGHGEFVGWTEDEHREMADYVAAFPVGVTTIGDHGQKAQAAPVLAAFEAALIDLALRQTKTTLLEDSASSGLNYVVSFSETMDPNKRCNTLNRVYQNAEFKIDVSESWTTQARGQLSARSDVRILDFKERYAAELAEEIRAEFPNAILEDPPVNWSATGPYAIDKSLLSVSDVRDGCFHNIKVPRLGGVLAALDVIARCQQIRASFYWGGMYEVGVGRRQAQRLAAAFCPNAFNDLAPLIFSPGGAIGSPLSLSRQSGFA